MKKIIFCLLFLFVAILPAIPAISTASPPSPLELANKIQQRYNRMESLRFHFTQQTSGEMTGRAQTGEGDAAFLRSHNKKEQKMRWCYRLPDEQLIVSDGSKLYMYFKELNQVIISPTSQMANDLTYAFFTGAGDLARDFTILATEQKQTIKLVPRTPQQQVAEIELQAESTGLITQITITDHFGTVTALAFDNIEINPFTDASAKSLQKLFTFTPPAGTEIIQQ